MQERSRGGSLKKYTKNSSEDRLFLMLFINDFFAISIGSTYLNFSGFIFEKSRNVPAGANPGVLPGGLSLAKILDKCF